MRESRYIIVLIVVFLLLSLFRLGGMALTDPDETFYAQTAKEMVNAGEWLTPQIFGKPQFEKPVLFYWLVMASYLVFGIGEFAARFPALLFGLAGIIGTYFMGRLFFSPLCGFLSGIVLATSMQYVILARACVTDMTLTVFILFCLLFFLLGWTREKRVYFLLSAVMAAFAVLTKGPIGLFIPGVIIGLYIVISRQWDKLRRVPIGWCALVFLAVSLPWYIAVMRVHGSAFIDEFFGFHNMVRFLEPEHRIGTSPFFYIPIIIGGFFPWSLFLPMGVWDMYKNGAVRSGVKGHRMFLLVWFLTLFIFFSISRTKLVTYIFPLFPVMGIVAGRFWERFILEPGTGGKLRGYMNTSYIIFGVSSVLALIGIFVVVSQKYAQALGGTALAESVFVIGLILSVFLLLRGKKLFSFFSIVLTVMLSFAVVIVHILPVIEQFETSKAVCYKVKELSSAGEPLGGESDKRRGIAFYADRTDIVDIHPYNDLVNFVSRPERVWCIMQRKHYDQLKNEKPDLVSEPLFQSGKNVVVTNKPFNTE